MPSASSRPVVTFSQYSQVASIPTDHVDLKAKWYSEDDHDFQQTMIRDARQMASELRTTPPTSITSEQLCNCVGIDLFLQDGLAMQVLSMKRSHTHEVLREQQLQRQRGISDVDKLAHVSQNSSEWMRERAYNLAVAYSKV